MNETYKQFKARKIRELAAQWKHDPKPVKPLSYIVTPMGDVVMLGKEDRRELAAVAFQPGYVGKDGAA